MENYKTQADGTLSLNLVQLINISAELHEMVTAPIAGTLHWSVNDEQGSSHSDFRDAEGSWGKDLLLVCEWNGTKYLDLGGLLRFLKTAIAFLALKFALI